VKRLDIITKLCYLLDLSNDVKKKSFEIFEEYINKNGNGNPLSMGDPLRIVSACIYIATILCGEHRRQEEISRVAGIGISSISRYQTKICDKCNIQLRV